LNLKKIKKLKKLKEIAADTWHAVLKKV